MKKDLVEFILYDQIVKFFSGIEISFEEDSGNQRKLVSCLPGGSKIGILCDEGGRFVVYRAQTFEPNETKIIRDVFHIAGDYEKLDEQIQKYLISNTVSRVIAKSIVDDDDSNKILKVARFIETLERWSGETYEGHRIAVSIGIDMNDIDSDGPTFEEYTKNDFSKVLTNGYDTLVEFSVGNNFIGYQTLNISPEIHNSPFRYTTFSKYTEGNNKIALVLNRNGEILIFKSGNLFFAKRRGDWRLFAYNSVLRQLAFKSRKLDRKLMESLYESILDVSFARTGACIGIVQQSKYKTFSNDERVNDSDYFGKNESDKTKVLLTAINNATFQSTDRRLRQEILGIDGAVVLNATGKFISAGAILKLEAGSDGGARLAAAKTLKDYGLSVKISADGEIKVFNQNSSFSFG